MSVDIEKLTKIGGLIALGYAGVLTIHNLANSSLEDAAYDAQIEAVISRLNRLCSWEEIPPELREVREQLKTKYHDLTDREFTGCE